MARNNGAYGGYRASKVYEHFLAAGRAYLNGETYTFSNWFHLTNENIAAAFAMTKHPRERVWYKYGYLRYMKNQAKESEKLLTQFEKKIEEFYCGKTERPRNRLPLPKPQNNAPNVNKIDPVNVEQNFADIVPEHAIETNERAEINVDQPSEIQQNPSFVLGSSSTANETVNSLNTDQNLLPRERWNDQEPVKVSDNFQNDGFGEKGPVDINTLMVELNLPPRIPRPVLTFPDETPVSTEEPNVRRVPVRRHRAKVVLEDDSDDDNIARPRKRTAPAINPIEPPVHHPQLDMAQNEANEPPQLTTSSSLHRDPVSNVENQMNNMQISGEQIASATEIPAPDGQSASNVVDTVPTIDNFLTEEELINREVDKMDVESLRSLAKWNRRKTFFKKAVRVAPKANKPPEIFSGNDGFRWIDANEKMPRLHKMFEHSHLNDEMKIIITKFAYLPPKTEILWRELCGNKETNASKYFKYCSAISEMIDGNILLPRTKKPDQRHATVDDIYLGYHI